MRKGMKSKGYAKGGAKMMKAKAGKMAKGYAKGGAKMMKAMGGKMAKGYSSTRTRTSITCTIAADATTGVITLSLTADQTSALEEGRYVYDLEILQTSSSTITRVIEGIISVRPQVTT